MQVFNAARGKQASMNILACLLASLLSTPTLATISLNSPESSPQTFLSKVRTSRRPSLSSPKILPKTFLSKMRTQNLTKDMSKRAEDFTRDLSLYLGKLMDEVSKLRRFNRYTVHTRSRDRSSLACYFRCKSHLNIFFIMY
jgi:hypothetical protein